MDYPRRVIELDRRTFLGAAAGAASGLGAAAGAMAGLGASAGVADAAAPVAEPSPPAESPGGDTPPPPPRVTLGPTGIQTSRLALGTGVRGGDRQSNQTRLGFARLVDLFHHAFERGVRMFDLADLYGTHLYFREALRTIPRQEVTILTKLWWRYDGPEEEVSAAFRGQACRTALERFRHELATDYLDIVLLHCLTDPAWPERMKPYLDELGAAKQRGEVRVVGVSCHDFGALRAAAATPWVELILARTNPEGVLMDAAPAEVEAVLRDAKAAGKAIVGMKIFGEGRLADQRERCIEYAQSREYLDAMTIGFETPDQIDEVLRLLARHPTRSA